MKQPQKLTPFETWVINQKGTEPAFSGLYVDHAIPGLYTCKQCHEELFSSDSKFPSHCGWPSFDDSLPGAVKEIPDADGQRTEIVCKRCNAHLGHVFLGENHTPKNIRHCVNSVSIDFKPAPLPTQCTLVVASGCFWGTQYFLARIPGVLQTQVGYAGGNVPNPTYEQVCKGQTGHLEVVKVDFDPSRVGLDEILKIFFETHDFSQVDGQGPDIGSQYLSAIFYNSQDEQQAAESLIANLKSMGHSVATSVRPLTQFWPAEDYHQLYYERKGDTPYCHRYRQIFSRSR